MNSGVSLLLAVAVFSSSITSNAAETPAQQASPDPVHFIQFDDKPDNQPVNRFQGQKPVSDRPADPLPAWRARPFKKRGVVIEPNPEIFWKAKSVLNPAAVVKDEKIYVIYRAQDTTGAGQWNGNSSLGIAVTEDGTHLHPLLFDAFGNELPLMSRSLPIELHGIEDPRVADLSSDPISYEGKSYRYHMTYTAFDGKMARLAQAISNDLIHWEKLGAVFLDTDVLKNPVVQNSPWTKSGAVVPRRIGGVYIMYFGEGKIRLAQSDDGVHWRYPLDPTPVLTTREGYFDQDLVEPGTTFVDAEGIHLTYHGDSPPRGYQLGEIVFNLEDPTQVIRRSSEPFLKPDQPYETTGQVGDVIFAPDLVFFKGSVYIYYGAADSVIGLAVARTRKVSL
jgi:predicted GH43/DUF377 family glycosyl hydrolase